MLSLSSIVVRKDELLESSVDNEIILLSIQNSQSYGLNPTASRIWELLNKPISIGEITQLIAEEFGVAESDCEKDVLSFITNLDSEKLIDIKT